MIIFLIGVVQDIIKPFITLCHLLTVHISNKLLPNEVICSNGSRALFILVSSEFTIL